MARLANLIILYFLMNFLKFFFLFFSYFATTLIIFRLIYEKLNVEMQKQTKEPDIEEIYDKYSKRLYFTSYRIVGNTLDSEEIMQDTLIKYYNYKDKTIINNLEHWLVSICIRQSIDLLRKKKREKFFIDEYSDNNNAIETETDSSNLHIQYNINDIKHNIELLPDILRIIISLHLLEGYDYQEISQITGLNENTIRSRYLRGKNKLVEMIKKI